MKPEVIVSVCCVTFNHKNYIEECLDGILSQDCNFPIEIIIHDDASTDGTQEIIKSYGKRHPQLIKPIFQKENQFSKGEKVTLLAMKEAKGKYIALCEGDDYWTDPSKLQKQVDFLEKNKEFVLVHHDAIIIDEDGKLLKTSKLLDVFKRDISSLELQKGATLLCLSLCFRNVINSYPKEIFNVSNGDTFLISLLGKFGGGKFLENIKPACYRIHSGGVWSEIGKVEKRLISIRTYANLRSYYRKDEILRDSYQKKIIDNYKIVIRAYAANFQIKKFIHTAGQFLSCNSGFPKVSDLYFLFKMIVKVLYCRFILKQTEK